MERNPTPQNVRRLSQLKGDLDKEKQAQTQSSWNTKTVSLNMERDSQELWQLTKSLIGDNSERGRTTLQTTNGAVKERRQQTSLPEFLKKGVQLHPQLIESKFSVFSTQTRAVLQNTASAGFDPSMTKCLILREHEEALKRKKQKKAPGPDGVTNEILKHLGPGANETADRLAKAAAKLP